MHLVQGVLGDRDDLLFELLADVFDFYDGFGFVHLGCHWFLKSIINMIRLKVKAVIEIEIDEEGMVHRYNVDALTYDEIVKKIN